MKVNPCRKRAGRSIILSLVVDAPDALWAIDFQFDATADGRPIKMANVNDERTRQTLGGQAPARAPATTCSPIGRIATDEAAGRP